MSQIIETIDVDVMETLGSLVGAGGHAVKKDLKNFKEFIGAQGAAAGDWRGTVDQLSTERAWSGADEELRDPVEGAGHELEVCPGAALAPREESGRGEDLEVMRHGGLAQADWFDEVADAGLGICRGGHDRQQAQPGGICQCLHGHSELLSFFRREWFADERCAADAGGDVRHLEQGGHILIVVDIDRRRYSDAESNIEVHRYPTGRML
jgi:hypothetical protein